MTPKTDAPVGEAEAIVREIVAVMTLRLADLGKVFVEGALDDWRAQLLISVDHQSKNGNWENDRPTVLAVARDMASIAAMLAFKGDVDKIRVDAAFQAVRAHRRCPPRGPSGFVLGCWCDCP